jgi:hypothetical protein
MTEFESGVEERNDPRNHTNQHEDLFVMFRVISWIVLIIVLTSLH